MGCGPIIKCRINGHGQCRLVTASFQDMETEAPHCGLIQVNERYLIQKYGVVYKDFQCRNCEKFKGSTHGICRLKGDSIYCGAHACGEFKKKEDDNLNCKINKCGFNNEAEGCGFESKDTSNKVFTEYAQEAIKLGCQNKDLQGALKKQTTSGKLTNVEKLENAKLDATCKHFKGFTYVGESKNPAICCDCKEKPNAFAGVVFMLENHFKPHCCLGTICTFGTYEKEIEKTELEVMALETSAPDSVQAFDYSAVDAETATFLQDKETKITQIKIMSVMAIGKELKEAQDKLANNKTGTFALWYESLGMNKDKVYRHINAYEYIVANCEDISFVENIQPSLLFAISKPSAPVELQKAVMDGDITTHKQYKEMEEKLKAAEAKVDTERNSYQRVSDSYNRLEKVNSEHYERAERAEKAKQALESELAATRSLNNMAAVERLEKELKEAQRQVEILTDELMKPVEMEAAVVEKIPEEIEKELEELRLSKNDGKMTNYQYLSEIIGKIVVANGGMMKDWAWAIGKHSSLTLLQNTRKNITDAISYFEGMIDYLDDEIELKKNN